MQENGVGTGTVAAGAVANVAEKIKGIDFPAGKWDVIARAEENGADGSVLDTLRLLPSDRQYEDPVQLFDAIGDEVRKLEATPHGSREEATSGGFRALLAKWRGKR